MPEEMTELEAARERLNRWFTAIDFLAMLNRYRLYIAGVVAVLLVVWIISGIVSAVKNSQAKQGARQVVMEVAGVTGTPNFTSVKVVAKRQRYYLIHVVLDTPVASDDASGNSFLVSVQLRMKGGSVAFDKAFCLQKASNPPTVKEIADAMVANSWPRK